MGAAAHRRYRTSLCAIELLVLISIFVSNRLNTTNIIKFIMLYFVFVIAGILIIVLIPQMNRTYDFSGALSSWSLLVERLCCISAHDDVASPRNWSMEVSYLTATAIDFIARMLVIAMLFSYRSADLNAITSILIFLDQVLYASGCLVYAVLLLNDQDLLRNLMEWFDYLIGRDRTQGYHHVYSLGYQFSARPGAMFLTLPLFYSLLFMLQILSIVVIGIFLILNKTDHIVNDCFVNNSNHFRKRVALLVSDFLFVMVTACSVPIVFHLEDVPRSAALYRLGSGWAIVIMMAQLFCKIFVLPYMYIQLASSDYREHECGGRYWFSILIDSVLLFNAVVFLFCYGCWLVATIMFTEYLGNDPRVWHSLVGCCVPQSLLLPNRPYSDDQPGAMFKYEMLPFPIAVILYSPWEFVGLCLFCMESNLSDSIEQDKITSLYIILIVNFFMPFVQAMESCRAAFILKYPWWCLAALVYGGPIVCAVTTGFGVHLTKHDVGSNWLSAIFITSVLRGSGVVYWFWAFSKDSWSKLLTIRRDIDNDINNNIMSNDNIENMQNPLAFDFEYLLPVDPARRRHFLTMMVQHDIETGQFSSDFRLLCQNELRQLNFDARRGILLLTFKMNKPERQHGSPDKGSVGSKATIAAFLQHLHSIEPYLWRHIVEYL